MPTITQAAIVTTALTNVPAATYSYVATYVQHDLVSATPQHTVTIATHAVGNLLVAVPVCCQTVNGTTITPSAPSGTGTGSWVDSGDGAVTNPSLSVGSLCMAMWLGKVTSVQASSVLTIPYTNSGTVSHSSLYVYEFSCSGVDANTNWTVDAHNHSLQSISFGITYPALGPIAGITPEIYLGVCNQNAGSPGAGSTNGFTYIGNTSDHNAGCYDLAVNAFVSPTGISDDSGPPTSQAILAYARISKAQFDTFDITLQPVPSGLFWIISQIGFEFIPINSFTTITCDVLKNGRAVKAGIDPNDGAFQGPPYINYYSGDVLTVRFYNAPVGSSAVCNFLYNEYHAGTNTRVDLGGVV